MLRPMKASFPCALRVRVQHDGMMAQSHVVVGVAGWVAVAPALHLPSFDPLYLALAVAGSLLPDIDHPQSWIGRRLRPVSTVLAAVLGHRGVTHSAVAVLGLVALLAQAGHRRGEVSAVALGYLSHLAADMLTPRGLRLAWPLRGNWGVPLCRTGSFMEPVLVAAFVCGVAGWMAFRGALPRWP